MTPRPYQIEAIDALDNALWTREDNPCIEIPTGGGKTPLMSFVIQKYMAMAPHLRVLVLAHVKELLQQGAAELKEIDPTIPIGVYSASLRSKSHNYAVTFAGIQSIWRKAREAMPWDLIFVDEAHRIPVADEGMYRYFLSEAKARCEHQRVVGWTATPYRLSGGQICGPNNILNYLAYRAKVGDLIEQGFLCRLTARCGKTPIDRSKLTASHGEFTPGTVETEVTRHLRDTVADIILRTQPRKKVLIFCVSLRHCQLISEEISRASGQQCEVVTSQTSVPQRDSVVRRFRNGEIKYLANINVFSEGFNVPDVDCIVLLRPTTSTGLYYQQVGRGLRLAPGKENCLILDFAGNIQTHGPIDLIEVTSTGLKKTVAERDAPAKVCPACYSIVSASYRECPDCGYQWPIEPVELKHQTSAADAAILSSEGTFDFQKIDGCSIDSYFLFSGEPVLQAQYHMENGTTVSEALFFDRGGGLIHESPRMVARQVWGTSSSHHFRVVPTGNGYGTGEMSGVTAEFRQSSDLQKRRQVLENCNISPTRSFSRYG